FFFHCALPHPHLPSFPTRRSSDLGKRPVILTLVYYRCPMLCTLVLNGLVRALRTLAFDPGREFELVTVSFDPRETPELAAKKKADRKSTRLNSSHQIISYAVFCLK